MPQSGPLFRPTTLPTALDRFILEMVDHHPTDIALITAETYHLSLPTVTHQLTALLASGALLCDTHDGSPRYRPAVLSYTSVMVPLQPSIEAQEIWYRYLRPVLHHYPPHITQPATDGITHSLKNVLDHAHSRSVAITIRETIATITITIADHGIGLFNKIQSACHGLDLRTAALELIKGKLTTDPARHRGEGIAVTARLFDEFELQSDGYCCGHAVPLTPEQGSGQWYWHQHPTPRPIGTSVRLRLHTARPLDEIVPASRWFTTPKDLSTTLIPVVMLAEGATPFQTRREAQRLLARIDQFKRVVLDFQGVLVIGPEFADEVFRVYPQQFPDIHFHWSGENASVQAVIQDALNADRAHPYRHHDDAFDF